MGPDFDPEEVKAPTGQIDQIDHGSKQPHYILLFGIAVEFSSSNDAADAREAAGDGVV